MARAPRARVSKTSGSGVSRLSYQKGYAKGNRGSAAAGGDVPSVPGSRASITDESLKGSRSRGPKVEKDGSINVSYGDTLPIGDLKDVQNYGKNGPKATTMFRPGKETKLSDKGRSAYAKK